ncbi:hypothetical protein FHS83_003813 [Rhizomicrobium palustre]|uniref:Putative auto-transporter adhesin head GIN domain-containing protein n=1 Tax=Rhizomicrobium palustre TaxID=189966 RepID=A0A846N4T8_9PROT|nr:DUF2807 domain-containing protein [Rhizomicrobium palustre]NIK90495.1 hypothetical protein [Rhizomicrobium palustre]
MTRIASLLASAALLTGASFAGTDLTLPAFSALNMHAGAHAKVHYGPQQKVTVIRGDMKVARVEVRGNVLDASACTGFCLGPHELELDIVTPHLDAITAHSGGGVSVDGAYPKQNRLDVTAHSGGSVEATAIAADSVDVTAHSGGSAHVKALTQLKAHAHSGGSVRYEGHPAQIENNTNSGGSVSGN